MKPSATIEEARDTWNAYAVEEFKKFLKDLEAQLPETIKRKVRSKKAGL